MDELVDAEGSRATSVQQRQNDPEAVGLGVAVSDVVELGVAVSEV